MKLIPRELASLHPACYKYCVDVMSKPMQYKNGVFCSNGSKYVLIYLHNKKRFHTYKNIVCAVISFKQIKKKSVMQDDQRVLLITLRLLY